MQVANLRVGQAWGLVLSGAILENTAIFGTGPSLRRMGWAPKAFGL